MSISIGSTAVNTGGFDWSGFFQNDAMNLLKGGANLFGAFKTGQVADEQMNAMKQNTRFAREDWEREKARRDRLRSLHF